MTHKQRIFRNWQDLSSYLELPEPTNYRDSKLKELKTNGGAIPPITKVMGILAIFL